MKVNITHSWTGGWYVWNLDGFIIGQYDTAEQAKNGCAGMGWEINKVERTHLGKAPGSLLIREAIQI